MNLLASMLAWAPAAYEVAPSPEPASPNVLDAYLPAWLPQELLIKVAGGLVVFLVLWILSRLVRGAVYNQLIRTEIDDRIADKLGIAKLLEKSKEDDPNALERLLANIVYVVLMLASLVAVLDYFGLEAAAKPIQGFLDEIAGALPEVGKALLIFGVAWLAGWALRAFVTAALGRLHLDKRFVEMSEDGDADDAEESQPVAHTIGAIVYWTFIFFGLAAALDALHIPVVSGPLQHAIDRVIGLLPTLASAGLLFAAGWFLGKIARAVVSNLLSSLGINAVAERLKIARVFGDLKASGVAGLLVMYFLILQFGIAALQQLNLTTLSGPLEEMMTRFWLVLPSVVVSGLMVFIAVVVGRLLNTFIAALLANAGFDELAAKLGLEKVAERQDKLGKPSDVTGFIVQVAVVLVATAEAFKNLGLDTWAGYVDTLLTFAVQHALVALVIVVIGFAIGNYVRDVIKAREGGSEWSAAFARVTVLVFAMTMALTQLGVAEDFVLLTFGLLFGALCLAMGLAFGLGSKDVAGDIVKRRYNKVKGPGGPLG